MNQTEEYHDDLKKKKKKKKKTGQNAITKCDVLQPRFWPHYIET